MDGSPVSLEKALQVVSYDLQDSTAWEEARQGEWILLTALKANKDQALWDATQFHTFQKKQEDLEGCICTLEAKICQSGPMRGQSWNLKGNLRKSPYCEPTQWVQQKMKPKQPQALEVMQWGS